jgi:hypothetical protein
MILTGIRLPNRQLSRAPPAAAIAPAVAPAASQRRHPDQRSNNAVYLAVPLRYEWGGSNAPDPARSANTTSVYFTIQASTTLRIHVEYDTQAAPAVGDLPSPGRCPALICLHLTRRASLPNPRTMGAGWMKTCVARGFRHRLAPTSAQPRVRSHAGPRKSPLPRAGLAYASGGH